MLAVTANWLLTDGSLAASRTAAAEDWLRTVRLAAIRAGFRNNGGYSPVESICLVFAGDTFEWLFSDAWSGRDRPWHGGKRGLTARSKVAWAAVRSARPVVTSLRRWARRGMALPAADARGRPSARSIRHAPIRVVMLAGDRDAWMVEAVGPADHVGVWAGESWSDGVMTIRHGHDLDPICHAAMDGQTDAIGRPPTLAESLTINLLVPFAMALRSEPAVWSLVRSHMRSLASAPLTELPREVSRLVTIWGAVAPAGRRLRHSWRTCVEAWRRKVCLEPPACETNHDVLDAVADWLDQEKDQDHEQGGASWRVPEAIASLTTAPSPLADGRMVIGHGPAGGASLATKPSESPWLAVVCRDGGGPWTEPLGQLAPGPAVVAIGAGSGMGVVEAA